jgi:hypothetical protein
MIEKEITETRKSLAGKEYEDRCLEVHSLILACAEASKKIFSMEIRFDSSNCLEAIANQTKDTKEIDVAYTFLRNLEVLVRSKKIDESIARIENDVLEIKSSEKNLIEKIEKETLIFSLENSLPLVRQFSKQNDSAITDAKTLASRLQALSLEKRKCRKLGNNCSTWFYEIPQAKD